MSPQLRDESPERTCVGCRQHAAKEDLVRFAIGLEPPYVTPDIARRLGGRGVSVHPARSCVEAAVKRGGFAKAARRPVSLRADELCGLLADQYRRRVEGLLSSARRVSGLAVGTDAVREAMAERTVELLIVAKDASNRRDDIERAAERLGNACMVFGAKTDLGRLLGRDEVGVLAVLHGGIAGELSRALSRMAALSEVE